MLNSEKNPNTTNLIRKIKSYLKEVSLVKRNNKKVWNIFNQKHTELKKPFLATYLFEMPDMSFSSFLYFAKDKEKYAHLDFNKASELILEEYKKNIQTVSDENNLPFDFGDYNIDLTLIHILYNRLRKSTKFHLGTEEQDNKYVENKKRAKTYIASSKDWQSIFDAHAKKLCETYQVPLEAFKGECHAS